MLSSTLRTRGSGCEAPAVDWRRAPWEMRSRKAAHHGRQAHGQEVLHGGGQHGGEQDAKGASACAHREQGAALRARLSARLGLPAALDRSTHGRQPQHTWAAKHTMAPRCCVPHSARPAHLLRCQRC